MWGFFLSKWKKKYFMLQSNMRFWGLGGAGAGGVEVGEASHLSTSAGSLLTRASKLNNLNYLPGVPQSEMIPLDGNHISALETNCWWVSEGEYKDGESVNSLPSSHAYSRITP